MTTPDIEELTADDPQDIMQWLTANSRWLTIASVVVVVAAASFWIYTQSQRTKEVNASKALLLAQQSMNAGNPGLAKSDLEKMTSRYLGTAAGSEAAMLLAQLNYDQAKFQEGVAVLERAAKAAPQPIEAEIRGLMGDGYLSMRNPVAAAKEYEHAADLTDHEMDRASQRARAARAYTVAADTAKARQLWESLSQNTKNLSVAAEARVRLGELSAKPATKS
jgi:predicted negative regulator of RcsB-dependent stress response